MSWLSTGKGRVVPASQGWNWSRKYGLSGTSDWPVVMLAKVAAGLERSAVKRSLGPKWRRAGTDAVTPSPGAGLQAGAGGHAEDPAEERVAPEDGVGDFNRVVAAVAPGGKIVRGVGGVEGPWKTAGGEKVVPVGVTGWEPA